MISFNVLFFWGTILFVFWLASLGTKKAPAVATVQIPAMTQPSMVRP
jgi:cytochrome bd ubiquinol oxidase subunit I